jgi:D-amino-acid dehydrogenase
MYAAALAEHEVLLAEAGATRYLRKNGWLKLFRGDQSFAKLDRELALAKEYGIPYRALDTDGARDLEPSLTPVFRHAVHWEGVASVNNPLAVTQAYAKRFAALGGVMMRGDARSLHRADGQWRIDTAEGPVDASQAVVTLGAFAPDLLAPLGIKLPLGIKRGYHRHYRGAGNAALARPVLDADVGYCLAPMEQGVRLTTGAEFAARDAPPTPVQFDRLLPKAKGLFPLGEPVEATPWMGSRPCFPDSRPVIGRAPGQDGLWLAYGHAHWGLTLGPATGRLIAEMMTGATPFCDPAPYAAERFIR